MQIEKLHDSGERAGLATAVMEHATAMVNLASALYVCKKLEEAKVGLYRGYREPPRLRRGGGGGVGTHPFLSLRAGGDSPSLS